LAKTFNRTVSPRTGFLTRRAGAPEKRFDYKMIAARGGVCYNIPKYRKAGSSVVILGIDPGYAIVGWGALLYEGGRFRVLGYGAVRTDAGQDFCDRLCTIHTQTEALIARFSPDALGIEQLFFNTNSTTAIGVAEARGCILLSAAQAGVKVLEYTPLQVKQSVTGYGKADKPQMQEMVKLLLGLKQVPKPDDTADALAVAICCAHSAGANARLQGQALRKPRAGI
jgi:crossover junction endodeoxyribonuclease RuvC